MVFLDPPLRSGPLGPRRPAGRRAGPLGLALALALAGASGCMDSPVDPLQGLATVETQPSLSLPVEVPTLADVVADAEPGSPALEEALVLWQASWSQEDGASLRTRARGAAVPALVQALGPQGVRELVQPLGWIAPGLGDVDALPPTVGEPVGRAHELAMAAREHLQAGDLSGALALGLEASDLFRSVTPEAVALRVVTRADALMASRDREQDVHERAVQLLRGARRALADGDFALAIQRGHYACQVLEGARIQTTGDFLREMEGDTATGPSGR